MRTMLNDIQSGKPINIHPGAAGGPIIGCPSAGEAKPEVAKDIQKTIHPVVTIDDLETQMEKILTDIRILKAINTRWA